MSCSEVHGETQISRRQKILLDVRRLHLMLFTQRIPAVAVDVAGEKCAHVWLYSKRVLLCVPWPVLAALLIACEVQVLSWNFAAWLVYVVIAVAFTAEIRLAWRDRAVDFVMYVQVAPHLQQSRTWDPQRRMEWYGRVRRWMEVNRLAGPVVDRWAWGRDSRTKFGVLYGCICRRAAGETAAIPKSDGMSKEELADWIEISERLEELPLPGEYLVHHAHRMAMRLAYQLEATIGFGFVFYSAMTGWH